MLVSNVAAEFQTSRCFSVNIPVYYSGLNYFASKVKFRTLTLQPELRYWLEGVGSGWFFGPHVGLGWYDVATGGKWRIQDKGGHTPAIGGGVGAGYRFIFSSNRRWSFEISLGLGVYHVEYDRFYNVRNGLLHDTHKRVFAGIDHFGVSFSYEFDIQRKGDKK